MSIKNKSGKTALDIALENQIRFSSEAEQHETITGQKKEITKKQKQNKSIITLLQSYLEDKAPAKKLNKKEGGGSGETVISNGSVKWSFGNSDPFIF